MALPSDNFNGMPFDAAWIKGAKWWIWQMFS